MKGNGHDGGQTPSNIASLDEARRQARKRERERAQGQAATSSRPPTRARQWIAGLILIAMAIGAIISFIAPLISAGRRAAG